MYVIVLEFIQFTKYNFHIFYFSDCTLELYVISSSPPYKNSSHVTYPINQRINTTNMVLEIIMLHIIIGRFYFKTSTIGIEKSSLLILENANVMGYNIIKE